MARTNLIKEIKILGLINLIEQEVSDDEIKSMADWVYKNKKDPELNKQSPMLSWASDPSQVEGGLRSKLKNADPKKRQQAVDYLRKRMGTNKPVEPAKQPEPAKATTAPTQAKPETKPEVRAETPTPTKASNEPSKKSWSQVRSSMGYSAKDSLTNNPNLLAAYNKYKEGSNG